MKTIDGTAVEIVNGFEGRRYVYIQNKKQCLLLADFGSKYTFVIGAMYSIDYIGDQYTTPRILAVRDCSNVYI